MRWLCWWRPPCVLRACIVNLTSDSTTALRGVLWSARGPWLIFRDCSVLKVGSSPAQMDGEVVLHRSQVAFLQVLP
jgi:hypothetical protein